MSPQALAGRTTGYPSPMAVWAMRVPSALVTYWIRGSIVSKDNRWGSGSAYRCPSLAAVEPVGP